MSSDPNDVTPPHLNRHSVYPSMLFKDGIKPYEITEIDPSFRTCISNWGRYEYGLIGITTAIPAYLGYSGQRKLNSFPVYVGLTAGLLAGICYAYAYSYSRLSGFMPKHPE